MNRVFLLGNVGQDPEIRSTPAGDCVASFSMATTKRWTRDGERHEQTEWHRCVAFRKTGEIVRNYVHKGTKILVEGEIKTRKWQDSNNQDRYTTEIVASAIVLLGAKDGQSGDQDSTSPAPQPTPQPQPAAASAAPADPFDDDLPF